VRNLVLVAMGLATAVGAAQQPTLSEVGPATPQEPDTLRAAQQLIDTDHFHEAEGALRSYLALNDLSGQAHEMLAYTLLRQNEPKESLAEYTRAAALERPSATMLERVGQDYVLVGDWPDADKWTLRAVQTDPADADAWYSLGRIRYSEQRFNDALSCFQKVLTLSPKSVKAQNNLGLTYEALNNTDAAADAYRKAIEWQDAAPAAQKSEQPLLNLAIVLLHRGDLAGAQPLLEEAVKLAPKDARIHEQLGHLYLQKADYGGARQEFQRACELDPKNSSLHFLLGQAYRHLGQTKEADAEFATSARLANDSGAH
jgi:Flp pilus assembly protein TadD